MGVLTLCEKCPNTEFFLVRIWTLFTHCQNQLQDIFKKKNHACIFFNNKTNFMPLVSTTWKRKKTPCFLMLSGGIERGQWLEMGQTSSMTEFNFDSKSIHNNIQHCNNHCIIFHNYTANISQFFNNFSIIL